MASWVTVKAPPPSLHLRLMHQSKDPMADPLVGGTSQFLSPDLVLLQTRQDKTRQYRLVLGCIAQTRLSGGGCGMLCVIAGSLTLTIEVTGAFALPSDGNDLSDPYCEIRCANT